MDLQELLHRTDIVAERAGIALYRVACGRQLDREQELSLISVREALSAIADGRSYQGHDPICMPFVVRALSQQWGTITLAAQGLSDLFDAALQGEAVSTVAGQEFCAALAQLALNAAHAGEND